MNLNELKLGDPLYIGKGGDWIKEFVEFIDNDIIVTDRGGFEVQRKDCPTYEGDADEDWTGVVITTDVNVVTENIRMLQEQITSSLIDFTRTR